MQCKEIMDTNTEAASVKIPDQQMSPAPIDEDRVSVEEKCGHWLGFWYGWWVCWWAAFYIPSIPISFFFSFLGRKLCCLILKASKKLSPCPVKLRYCCSIDKHLMRQRDKEEACIAEGLSEETSRWRNLTPGIVLGVVIGVFQITNCILCHIEVGGAIFGVIFGFVLMVFNAYIFKIVV